jgi:hypothetical protein
LALVYYLRLSVDRGRDCTVSVSTIARQLGIPRTTAESALRDWPVVKRDGLNGERRRPWFIVGRDEKPIIAPLMGKPSPACPKARRPTDEKLVTPQESLGKTQERISRKNTSASRSVPNAHASRTWEQRSGPTDLATVLGRRGTEARESAPATVKPPEELVAQHTDSLKPYAKDRKLCIGLVIGKPFDGKTKVFNQAMQTLLDDTFLSACGYAIAWREHNKLVAEASAPVLCNRFKAALKRRALRQGAA